MSQVQKMIAGEQMSIQMPPSYDAYIDILLDLLQGEEAEVAANLNAAVNDVLAQVLAFMGVVMAEDKFKIESVCLAVLEKRIEFEKLVQEGHSFLLAVAEIRRQVLDLDNLLNECLLRVITDVLVTLLEDPLPKIKEEQLPQTNNVDSVNFDLLLDRITQIGLLGVNFTDDSAGELLVDRGKCVPFPFNQSIGIICSQIEYPKCSGFGGIVGRASGAGTAAITE